MRQVFSRYNIVTRMQSHGQPGNILLISCYELGHQPAGIAMASGFLRQAGLHAEAMDVSVEGFDIDKVKRAKFVGVSVPMHTALRLGVRVAAKVREIYPECHICFYGLYATLNADYLLNTIADSIVGGEFEAVLVELAIAVLSRAPIDIEGVSTRTKRAGTVLKRLDFTAPDRSALGPLEHYARLEYRGELRLVGYVEATRGCLHHCTHCPIPPVYGGRFFAVPAEVVLEDIRDLVDSGARHITFGDPDFLNGPTHSLRVARALHEEFPELTFDFTAKIEHLIKHREVVRQMGMLGCIFVVSAVESLSGVVLEHLRKGHKRGDVDRALEILRDAGIALRPSFVAFTPWTTIDDYVEMLDWVEVQGLIDNIDPVQYGIRLLAPPGSLLISDPDTARWFGSLNQELFTYVWSHPDSRMDELHGQITRLVERAVEKGEDQTETFYRIRELAGATRGDGERLSRAMPIGAPARLKPPRLTEAWFC